MEYRKSCRERDFVIRGYRQKEKQAEEGCGGVTFDVR